MRLAAKDTGAKVKWDRADLVLALVYIPITVIAFFFFCHEDILITAQHSYVLLEGHITDFYSSCKELNGMYGANYLPLTFLVFAIWNLPIKLMGFTPTYWGDWHPVYVYWNKLLPTICFFACAYLIYKIVKENFGYSAKKAKLTMLLFATTPIAIYSQLFFSQYDVFTVFFMLLGLYFYFKEGRTSKDFFLFTFFFAIATCFKYFAALIYIALLLLSVKNVWKIILGVFTLCVPCGAQVLFYFITDRYAFKQAVFGFNALDYVDTSSIYVGFASVKLLFLFLFLVLAACYFTKPEGRETYIGYSIYYACGICAALFSLMTWHPQWLLFAVPFWILGFSFNKNNKIFLWLDILLSGVFTVFVSIAYINNADQNLLKNGILASALKCCIDADFTMSSIFRYDDADLLFTFLAALFLIYFIFTNPRFNLKPVKEEFGKVRGLITGRFLIGTLVFIIPAFMCIPSMLKLPENLWAQYDYNDSVKELISPRGDIVQYATIPGDSITGVNIKINVPKETEYEEDSLVLEIIDPESGELLASSALKEEDLTKKGEAFFQVEDCSVTPDRQYKFVLKYKYGGRQPIYIVYGRNPQDIKGNMSDVVQQDYDSDYIEIGRETYPQYHLIYSIEGHYRK